MTVQELIDKLVSLPPGAEVELMVGRSDWDYNIWNFASQVTLGFVSASGGGFLPVGTELAIIRGEHARVDMNMPETENQS